MPGPTIGITLDNLDNTAASGRYDVGIGYAKAVADAGGTPVMLAHEMTALPGYLDICDGFILTGGVDPDTAALPRDWPSFEPMHLEARPMDAARQAFELSLLDRLEATPNTPVLGICLGMQLMTLHHGGTLYQYMPDVFEQGIVDRHRNADHTVTCHADDSVLPQATAAIHSHHQQAIDSPGRLRVVATSEDGIIEAVDHPDRPFYLGVQWHPERTLNPADGATNPFGHGIIHKLVYAATKS
jgi:putative glutamine amidotransferase